MNGYLIKQGEASEEIRNLEAALRKRETAASTQVKDYSSQGHEKQMRNDIIVWVLVAKNFLTYTALLYSSDPLQGFEDSQLEAKFVTKNLTTDWTNIVV